MSDYNSFPITKQLILFISYQLSIEITLWIFFVFGI